MASVFLNSSLLGTFSDPDEDIASLVSQTSKASTFLELQQMNT
jgi:hypothetical protein